MNTAVRVTVGPCPQGALVQWLPTAKRRTVLRIRPWSDCPVILRALALECFLICSSVHPTQTSKTTPGEWSLILPANETLPLLEFSGHLERNFSIH